MDKQWQKRHRKARPAPLYKWLNLSLTDNEPIDDATEEALKKLIGELWILWPYLTRLLRLPQQVVQFDLGIPVMEEHSQLAFSAMVIHTPNSSDLLKMCSFSWRVSGMISPESDERHWTFEEAADWLPLRVKPPE